MTREHTHVTVCCPDWDLHLVVGLTGSVIVRIRTYYTALRMPHTAYLTARTHVTRYTTYRTRTPPPLHATAVPHLALTLLLHAHLSTPQFRLPPRRYAVLHHDTAVVCWCFLATFIDVTRVVYHTPTSAVVRIHFLAV